MVYRLHRLGEILLRFPRNMETADTLRFWLPRPRPGLGGVGGSAPKGALRRCRPEVRSLGRHMFWPTMGPQTLVLDDNWCSRLGASRGSRV